MRRALLAVSVLTSAPLVLSFTFPGEREDKITAELVGIALAPDATGTAEIRNNTSGPDSLDLRVERMPPNLRVTVFLGEDQTPGGLPVQFLGEFTTDHKGRGRLRVATEIVNAFATANQSMENELGIARNQGNFPDLLENGANTIPLNWFRGYAAVDSGTVFGPDENTPGGPPVFIQETPLP